jgi:hypothetical protein
MMEETLFKDQLNCVNTQLKMERIGVTIVKKGNRLYLRGTFPPRPGSTKSRPHQQEIALGLLAKAEGLLTAEKEARKVGGLLALGEFDWEPYVRHAPKDERPCLTIGDWVKQEAGEQGETRTGLVLRPSNELIVEYSHRLTAWPGQQAWAIGVFTSFGFRSQELLLFHIDLGRFKSDNGVLTVVAPKTGARQTWPVHPEWVEQFSLLSVKVPQCTGNRGRDSGQRISQYFWQNNIPFRPYDSQLCWVIRSIHYGLDISLAAQQMGIQQSCLLRLTRPGWLFNIINRRVRGCWLPPSRPLPPPERDTIEQLQPSGRGKTLKSSARWEFFTQLS